MLVLTLQIERKVLASPCWIIQSFYEGGNQYRWNVEGDSPTTHSWNTHLHQL